MTGPGRVRLYGGLFVAIGVISCAGVIIKLADAPALVIAAWRMGLATVLLAPWMAMKVRRAGFDALWRCWPWVLASGLALAAHFASWILSLEFTSVASSVVLVTTNPVFVGIGSYLFLKEKPTRELGMGILVSVLGGVLIGYGDWKLSGLALWGDVLALIGALSASAYFLIGRRLRAQAALGPYIFLVYGTAAVILVGAAALMGHSLWGYPAETLTLFLLLALGPQLVGHSTLNWALRYLPAGVIAVSLLAEPVGAALLAYWMLGESLTPLTLIGGGVVLVGIYFALKRPSVEKPRKV